MPTRTNKARKAYKKHLKNLPETLDCEFCIISKDHGQFISETKSFKVFRNIFPYSSWDYMKTDDHLLVVPKKHTDKLADFTAPESVEFMGIIGSYESQGYNIYARAPQTVSKSVMHQHTHLIKPVGKVHRFIFFIGKPYIRFMR